MLLFCIIYIYIYIYIYIAKSKQMSKSTTDSAWINRSLKVSNLRENNDEKIQDSKKLLEVCIY